MSERTDLGPDDVLVLSGSGFDADALHRAVAPLGLQPGITTRWRLVERELKELLLEHGVSYLWQLVELQEAVMPPSPDLPALLAVLNGMIARLAPSQRFVVVDRFLLSERASSDYMDNLVSVLEPVARRVQEVRLVVGPRYEAPLFAELKQRLSQSASACQLDLRTSERFHDRFWIADLCRGLFVGTSLNGIGKRYALVDFLHSADVEEIVNGLRAEGII